MKRWATLALSGVLVLSMTALAVADEAEEAEAPSELNDKQVQRALSLAEFFAIRGGDEDPEFDPEAATTDLNDIVVELRTGDDSTGWGVIYKLLLLAEYNGQDLDELVTELRSDSDGWKLGQWLKTMRQDEEWQNGSDTPKNFGQFKKQQKDK